MGVKCLPSGVPPQGLVLRAVWGGHREGGDADLTKLPFHEILQ